MQELKTKKICNTCNQEKELTEFYNQKKKNAAGDEYIYYQPYCKECASKRSYEWSLDNKDKKKILIKKYNNTKKAKETRNKYNHTKFKSVYKEWQKNNPDKLKQYGVYRNMNKKHEITKEEWENCKNYFSYRCAYCGIAIEEHYIVRNGEKRLGDFHRDHVDHDGLNDLSNCLPSCRSCNSSKWVYKLEEWYNEDNEKFSQERLYKIEKWLNEDFKKYIKLNN